MPHTLSIALALGIATAAAAQAPPNIPLNQPPRQELPALPDRTHHEPLAPGKLDLIGMPIAPPPVTSWLVGEPVTEYKQGTVYVFSMTGGAQTNPPPMGPVDHRFYLGNLQEKYGEAIVVTELTNWDGRQLTVKRQAVNSTAENPDVRTRVGRCSAQAFDRWCGDEVLFRDCLTAIVGADGNLACVVRNYHTLPWVLEQVIAGTFDARAYVQANEAADAIMKREPLPQTPEDRLARYDEIVKVAPWLSHGLTHERARLLCNSGRPEIAAQLVRDAVTAMPIVDRWWLKGIAGLYSRVDEKTTLMGPIALDIAKTIAATSDMQNVLELRDVVNLARTMRDYDTAITYQTMIIALAKTELEQYTETRELRELEEEAKKH